MPEIDRLTLRRLSRRSNRRGLAQLAAHCALLSATGLLIYATQGSAWRIPAIVLHGVVLTFLFCALHESIHRTAFRSRKLNDAVAWIAGAVLLLPPQYFRRFHFAHHRFTQDPLRDPELAQPPPATLGTYLWRATGLPNWRNRLTITLRHALTGKVAEPFVPARERALVVREARLLWLLYGSIAALSLWAGRTEALTYWVLPIAAGQPFLRLFLLAEHFGCSSAQNMFANTRTTYTSGAVRLLTWQMPFHVEHHAYPAVPFHALASLNRLVRDRIEVSAPGYCALHLRVLRQLRARTSAERRAD